MEGRGVKRDQRMAAYWFEKSSALKATLQDGTLDPGTQVQ
jgi:TPR repeat protein